MLSDFHIHSQFSADSDESPKRIILQAIDKHMEEICFTDHQDFLWPMPDESFDLDASAYFDMLLPLKEKYQSQIQLHLGVELGLTTDNYKQNTHFIKNYPFEYIIGSCHIVDNMDPYYSEFWKNRQDREAFEKYFQTLFESLKLFSSFHTLGHLDYIVRYSPKKDANYTPFDYFDWIDEILKLIIFHGIALEINTGALAKGMPFANPHTDILARYKELGGRLVAVGSDAHSADTIGYGFSQIEPLIQKYHFHLIKI